MDKLSINKNSHLKRCQISKCSELRSKIDVKEVKISEEIQLLTKYIKDETNNFLTSLSNAKDKLTPVKYDITKIKLSNKYNKKLKSIKSQLDKMKNKINILMRSKNAIKLQKCTYDNCYNDILKEIEYQIKGLDLVCQMLDERLESHDKSKSPPCQLQDELSKVHEKMVSQNSKLSRDEYIDFYKSIIKLSNQMA